MTIKVGINGYGRIGRNILRALYEGDKRSEIEVVAVNDLGDANTNAHLTRRDTAHGPFPGTIEVDGEHMIVNGDRIRVLAERDPAQLPWGELGVEVVLESTGFFRTREAAGKHLQAGAKKVIISAPGGKDIDATIVLSLWSESSHRPFGQFQAVSLVQYRNMDLVRRSRLWKYK